MCSQKTCTLKIGKLRTFVKQQNLQRIYISIVHMLLGWRKGFSYLRAWSDICEWWPKSGTVLKQ